MAGIGDLRQREGTRAAVAAGPDEIAAVFRFLASDEAAAVTGARIPLNGRA